MALKLAEKQQIISEFVKIAKESISCVVADYRGLTSEQLNAFRQKARENDVHVQVIRNTLANRGVQNTEFECVAPVLVGPVILAFAKHEPGAAAKLVQSFTKEFDNFEVRGVALGGKLFGHEKLEAIANLPNKEQALAGLCAVLQAPITKFVRTLAAPHTKLVRTLLAIKQQKEENQAA